MSTSEIFNTILTFMKEGPVEYITAATVIFKAKEIDLNILKEDLLNLLINAINKLQINKNSYRYKKIN